jgi:Putative peptidoglycan binding domain
VRRPATLALLAAALLAAPASALAARPPLETSALWVARAPLSVTPQQLAAEATAAGVRTLFVRAAEGTTAEPGFTAEFVAALRAQGIGVCAWTFVYGADPDAEAAAAVAAARAGAQCLVVDAEGQYDSRYGSAQRYVGDLRAALGARFPIGLAGQAEVLQHPRFPYSVFFGPGGFTVDMPQLYWRELGLGVAAAFRLAGGQNAWYGRPLAPVGQLFDAPSPAEVSTFVRAASPRGGHGFSLFDLEAEPAATIAAGLHGASGSGPRFAPPATVRPGADGDEVVWAQEHLNGAGADLPVGGFYGAETARAVASFQRRRRLRATGVLDAPTWRALLRVRPKVPSWAAAPPLSAR